MFHRLAWAILSLSLNRDEELSVLQSKESTGKLPQGGLPRNCKVRITDHARSEMCRMAC